MKKLSAIILASMLMQAPAFAENIKVNNTNRSYIVYAPKNLGSGRPLLISCHGMNQDANYQKGMLSIESIADTAKFLTVFPEGIDKSWDISGDRDLKFMEALIDEMVDKYDIDRNRVYISGFSMGGMFTYHCMNRMADKFAAFAPISGYPMGGGTYTSSRPVPIIHTHGTADDVVGFSGVSGILSGWVKRNGCDTKASVVKNYRKAPHITRHTWSGGEDGVEVVLMEMADKGHWISNDYGVYTGDEIWRFCSRYSLVLTDPSVRITSPDNGLTYLTFGGNGTTEVSDIIVNATATDPDGTVEKVSFYLGSELLSEQTEAPYTCTINQLKKGDNVIRVVATDNEGNTGSSQRIITVTEYNATQLYTMSKQFNTVGSVPEGWVTYDGENERIGFSSGYNSGSRVFQFTASEKSFSWGLYTRNVTGKEKVGYARFGDEKSSMALILNPGNYQILTNIVNWNKPEFSPVTVAVETIDGQQVFAETFTPTVNVGNTASNSFPGSAVRTLSFNIFEKNRYVITFYTADAPWADLVVGPTAITRKGNVSAIEGVEVENRVVETLYYNMAGLCVEPTTPGMYIRKDIYQNGTFKSRVEVRK